VCLKVWRNPRTVHTWEEKGSWSNLRNSLVVSGASLGHRIRVGSISALRSLGIGPLGASIERRSQKCEMNSRGRTASMRFNNVEVPSRAGLGSSGTRRTRGIKGGEVLLNSDERRLETNKRTSAADNECTKTVNARARPGRSWSRGRSDGVT